MSERARTTLLVFLVVLSIILSFFMWYGMTWPYVSSPTGNVQEISPAILLNILKPEKIIINFGGTTHTTMLENNSFDASWREFQNIVFSDSGNPTTVTETEFMNAMSYRSIMYMFAFPIPLSYFNDAYGKEINIPVDTVKDVIILAGNSPSFYIYDGFDKYIRMNMGYKNNGIETIISVKEDNAPLYSTAGDLGFTDKMHYDVLMPLDISKIDIPVIGVRKPDNIEMNTLVSKFFDSGSMVRRINEVSGDTVFTDGERGLKIYTDGRLEYTYSATSSARLDDVTSIKIATEFLSRYITNMNNVSLGGIVEGKDGYTINYNLRYNGLPVYSRQYGYPFIVEVKGKEVVSFKTAGLDFMPLGSSTRIFVGALDAMDASLAKGIEYWESLDMCYVVDMGKVRAAWRASDGEHTVYVDMENDNM
ncbi:two-component system activity regulator YycH [Calorimonas adulescens]|nr:two-component system activity regulator YycH [Calorimonas adulescens]